MNHVEALQVRALRQDADAHHDAELMAVCDQALNGDAAALAECLAVIEAARTCELCGEPAAGGSALCPACLEAR